ncbi:MAG: polyprenyl synthetase family protein [Bacteroidales bacterium]|nr:polyprenyl synthetase family protein [Bacteroidales bacterium]HOY38335.1 polyprenyl synthetase family protein [Bacteroidales bacterium]HQP03430.1 polyprenyl synthetase family protein [Bacteroidales bacterium]
MNTQGNITDIIQDDLKAFEKRLKEFTSSTNPYVSEMLDYILSSKGKLIRPIMVYLSARMFGTPNETTHIAAVLLELIHSSTLVHDDVVDESSLRRGKPSVNAIWENKRAVLIGDYMYANAMVIATQKGEHKLFDLISPTIMKMSLGELIQLDNSQKNNFEESVYLEVIENKTASLISTCCKAGAFSVGAGDEMQKRIGEFGVTCGMAFQIKDDILDYKPANRTGKTTGNDILERKATLPLIGAIKNAENRITQNVLQYWKNGNDNNYLLSLVTKYVLENKGIVYAENRMKEYYNTAAAQLNSFCDSPAKTAMQKVLEFVIDREK